MESIVFCDFDGTITMDDMMIAVWRRFAPPGWERTVEDMLAHRKSLREGVQELFAGIPSARRDEIIAYVKEVARFRPGLREFLAFAREHDIGFIVLSGGVDFFVRPLLEPFAPWIQRIYTIPADLTSDTIRLRNPEGCERCGLCKAAVIQGYPDAYHILIGDSVTDLHGAEVADLVLARGRLKHILQEQGKPCKAFETFFDVRDILAGRLLAPSRAPSGRGTGA